MIKRPAIDELVLPHSLEAERSVLGAILLHNDAYVRSAGQITPQDFYRDAHRRIYAAMIALLEPRGGTVDFVTLQDYLGRHGDLEEVGGPAYLASLVDGIPRSENVGQYVSLVKAKSVLRAVIAAANAILTDAYVGEEAPEAILQRADHALLALGHRDGLSRLRSTRETAGDLLATLEYRHANRGVLSGVPTGFESIDALTGGWQAGDLIIIASRPSIGKTTFMLNTAVAAARAGHRPAVFSLEMRRQQLECRLLASLSGIPLSTILGGWTSEMQWPALSHAMMTLGDLPILIDDGARRTVSDIRHEARRLRAGDGIGAVIIDYIQLMQGTVERRGATRNEEIADISRRCKILADELAVPVIVLSQLSRGGDGRADSRPRLSDLRDSGALEQDADLVCFLHRRHHRESGTTNFIIEKHRNGPTGTVNLTMEREMTRFHDGGEEPVPVEPEAEDHDAKTRAIIRQRARGAR